jgi:hypothetical protein
METLLNAVTSDTVGSGIQFSAPALLVFEGLAEGTEVFIEVSKDNSIYVPADFDGSGAFKVMHNGAKLLGLPTLSDSLFVRARAVGVVAASPVTVSGLL